MKAESAVAGSVVSCDTPLQTGGSQLCCTETAGSVARDERFITLSHAVKPMTAMKKKKTQANVKTQEEHTHHLFCIYYTLDLTSVGETLYYIIDAIFIPPSVRRLLS